ncbi:MAG: cohesin domain-containing protein [Candidatus Woesearchaeota archaeon]
MKHALLLLIFLSVTALADTYTLEPVDASVPIPGTIVLNLMANNAQPIYGLELTVKDTPELAVFSHIDTTSRTTGALATSTPTGIDTVKVALILSGTGNGIAPGNGSILKIYYSVNSGTGGVTFDATNFKIYNKTGFALSTPSINDATVSLISSSSSSSTGSSGSGGGSGGGGGGSGGGSSGKSSSSSASTSANTQLPFSFPETRTAKEKLAPTLPPPVIETKAAPATDKTPEPTAHEQPKKPIWPWIAGMLVFVLGTLFIIHVYRKQSKLEN